MEKVALRKIARIRSGYPFRHRPERADGGGCALVQMRDLDNARGCVREQLEQISPPENWESHRLHAGDILIAARGPRNDAAQYLDESDAIPASHLLVLRPGSTKTVLPAYLAWYLNRPETQEQLSSLRKGTNIAFLSTEALKGLEIPLPDVETQNQVMRLHQLGLEESRLAAAIKSKKQELLKGVFQTLLAKRTTI